jgi:CheY-like chemotaxis protein
MALFGMKKAKPSEGSELVLAYLEDAQRVRATLFAVDSKAREIQASLVTVTEEKVTLGLQGRVMAEKGETIALLFFLDGLRFRTAGRVLEPKPGTLVMELPGSIELAERRKKPRARLNLREGATATALTGLFEGIGLTGTIDNISEGGFCMKVGRAMNVKTQGPMHLGPNLLSVGEPFMLIKLSKLPKCPLIELAGTVTHVVSEGNGLSVGFAFEKGKEGVLSPVKALVASRASAIPTAVPSKARRQPEAKGPGEETIELAARPPQAKTPEPPVPETIPTASSPGPSARPAPVDAAVEPPPSTPESPEPSNRGSALLRVKKRSRGLLLAMPEGPERDELAAFLLQDGYGRVALAATLTEALTRLNDAQLVLVEGVIELQGLPLASLLHQRLEQETTPVLLAASEVNAELVLGAREAGVAQVLVKPYELDGDFLRMIEGHLGIG